MINISFWFKTCCTLLPVAKSSKEESGSMAETKNNQNSVIMNSYGMGKYGLIQFYFKALSSLISGQ